MITMKQIQKGVPMSTKRKKLSATMLCLVFMITSIITSSVTTYGSVDSVTSITLNVKSKITMYTGSNQTLKVKAVKPKGSSANVVYESSAPEVVKVSRKGKITAQKAGKATITVTSSVNEKIRKEVQVTVKDVVKNTAQNKVVIPLDKKKTLKFSCAVKASNLSFISSKKSVATVDKKGVIKAKKAGTAKITVKGLKGEAKGAKQIITVYVAKKSVKNVTLNETKKTLQIGQTFSLKPTVNPATAANVVTFKSSKSSVASVNKNGKITAIRKGTAKITVSTIDGKKKVVCTVIVTEPAETVKPTETVRPTKNVEPTETLVPTKSIKPTETVIPTKSVKPTETVIPTKSVKPTDAVIPTNTVKPTATARPTIPPSEDTEITAAVPVKLSDLEAKFPAEPEYPALRLSAGDMEVNLKDDLLTLDVSAGTKVRTKGYYEINDGGQACYEIMTYDDWWNQLPVELKMVTYHNDRIGVNQVFYQNPADNYGNHRLNNGMVAKLLPNEDGYIRVEQWGLFPGRDDNNRALIHIFANNHQNSKILFGKNAEYVLYYDTKNQAYQNKNGIIASVPWWLSENSIGNNGNEYAVMLHCRQTAKPVIGDAKNVELCGNGATITIPENEFCKGSTADFAMIETGGYVDGLTIHGFQFDSNGLQQYQYYDEAKKEYAAMRTTNHTISYFSSAFNVGLGEKEATTAVTDGNGKQVMGDTTWAEVKNYNNREKMCFNNVEIYGNTFLANGTSVDIPDGGGDDLLIINPEESENVNIHNNKMYNWGRWVLAVDLGGNGERFYNYTFKQNICIQDETNSTYRVDGTTATPTNRMRGLGWIDFEARKCFTNLDVSENFVYGANGWAFNGNGKISEDIKINANNITRPGFSWKSIYPYAFEFYHVYAKDIKVINNKFQNGGSIRWGNLSYNMLLENNDFGNASFGITRPLGNIIVRNNFGTGIRNQTYNISAPADLPWIEDTDSPYYLPPEERTADILFEGNSTGGIVTNIVVTDSENDYRKNMTLTFKDNKFAKFVVNAIGIKDFYFTPDQLTTSEMAWSARGCKYSSPVICRSVDNPVPGGLYYKEGDLVTESLDKVTRLFGPKYYSEIFTDLRNANGSIKKEQDMYCTKEGVFPVNGEFLNCDADAYFTANTEYKVGTFIYTEDNLYYVSKEGTSGETVPTHVSGTQPNGTAELFWVAPIARYEMRDKKAK